MNANTNCLSHSFKSLKHSIKWMFTLNPWVDCQFSCLCHYKRRKKVPVVSCRQTKPMKKGHLRYFLRVITWTLGGPQSKGKCFLTWLCKSVLRLWLRLQGIFKAQSTPHQKKTPPHNLKAWVTQHQKLFWFLISEKWSCILLALQ